MADPQDKIVVPSDPAAVELRDEDGAIRPEYVERVVEAIYASDAATLRNLVGDLHEADIGDLIEALDPEDRPRLVTLMGADFDFTALTEVDDAVREDILEELSTSTVAEGVRDLDSDDAVRNGQYTAWVYNRILKRSDDVGVTDATISAFHDDLRDVITSTTATQNGGILVSTLNVERFADGGLVTPK